MITTGNNNMYILRYVKTTTKRFQTFSSPATETDPQIHICTLVTAPQPHPNDQSSKFKSNTTQIDSTTDM